MSKRYSLKSAIKRLVRKFRKPKKEMHPPLWRTLEANLHLGPIITSSEWAVMIRVIANEMEKQIVGDAGSPIGIYFKEAPLEWLRHEAMRAANRL